MVAMVSMSSESWNNHHLAGEENRAEAADSTGGEHGPVEWVRVACAVGTPNAIVIAGRLESCRIPTRVTQESAGVFGYAVNVGLLGVAHVWVPEDFREQAESMMQVDWYEEE